MTERRSRWIASNGLRVLKVLFAAAILVVATAGGAAINDSDLLLIFRLILLPIAAILIASAGAPAVPVAIVALAAGGVLLFEGAEGLLCDIRGFGRIRTSSTCVPDPSVFG